MKKSSRTPASDPSPPEPTRKKRGTGKPGNQGIKATASVVEQRIYAVAKLLARRVPKHEIKRALLKEDDIGARQAETYISRAREWLIKQSKRPCDEFVSEAIGFYEEIIRDPASKNHERMQAQDALCRLLGLDAPVKVAQTTVDGKSLPPELIQQLPQEYLEMLREVRRRHLALQAAAANGENDGNGEAIDVKALPAPSATNGKSKPAAGNGKAAGTNGHGGGNSNGDAGGTNGHAE